MKTVFVCGPYTTGGDIARNIRIAIKAAQYLRDRGYNAFCPHVAIAGYMKDWSDDNPTQRNIIRMMCLQWVSLCDCIAMIPGWEKSEMCRAELAVAATESKIQINLTFGQIGV